MLDLSTLALLTTNLAAGRDPRLLQALDAGTSAPTDIGGGYSLSVASSGGTRLAMAATFKVAVREYPWKRTAYGVITTVDLTATYTVVVAGNTVAYDASSSSPADLAELLTEWAAAVNADGTVGALGVATPYDYDGDGVNDSIRFRGATTADYSWSATAGGSAVVVQYADPAEARVRFYALGGTIGGTTYAPGASGTRVKGWGLMHTPEGSPYDMTVGTDGFRAQLDVRGASRAWIELVSATGVTGDHASVAYPVGCVVMPCGVESTT